MNNNLFLPADILLPKKNFSEWSVIACDQYTSEPKYWDEVKANAGNTPSALNIVFPEVYLGEDNAEKIKEINSNMQKYLESDVFNTYEKTFVFVKRTVTGGKSRKGIVGLIDLENYSAEPNSKTLIRATEETVASRVPPRVEIRRDAPIEIPHIMLLIDDPNKTVIEPLDKSTANTAPLYDFDLMQNGGHITGTALDRETADSVQNALSELIENTDDKLLFAVGDGNHSLAAAKECYKLNKTENSRYALVEIVNIHDSSLEFEPIYRVLFGVEPQAVIDGFIESLGGEYSGTDAQQYTCVYGKRERKISVKPTAKLAVGTLQAYLDKLLSENKDIKIDYIHGIDSVKTLAGKDNALGFIFDGMRKDELFEAVKADGSLPRKTFSMGHANDKRFYLECKAL